MQDEPTQEQIRGHIKTPQFEIDIEELLRKYLNLLKARDDYSPEMILTELQPQIIKIVNQELKSLDEKWYDSEKLLNREANFEERRLQDEVNYWKSKNYELGGR